MPLLQEWTENNGTVAAIWQIIEPEAFFATSTGLHSDIKNDKRRIEFFAGRYLLQLLKADFELHNIARDEHDKPQMAGGGLHFSLSHSFPYIAAAINTEHPCGIDIQTSHPRILLLGNKFLSAREKEIFRNDEHLITLAWTIKEAAYKWQGRRGVDFIRDLKIRNFFHREKDWLTEMTCISGHKKQNIIIRSFYNQSFYFSTTI